VFKALQTLGSFQIREQYQVGEKLRIDFVILELRLGVEFDGSQHYEFNGHFYDSKIAFKQAQARDKRKDELCRQANIMLVRLDEQTIKKAKDAESLAKEILKRVQEKRIQSLTEYDEW